MATGALTALLSALMFALLLALSTPLSAADMSETGLAPGGDTYQCPEVPPEDPDALAEYMSYACADYFATGSISPPVEGTSPTDGTMPPIDGGGPIECPLDPVDEDCIPPGDMPKGNNGVGNGLDPQPPGNPPINDGEGTGPGNPGNQGGPNN